MKINQRLLLCCKARKLETQGHIVMWSPTKQDFLVFTRKGGDTQKRAEIGKKRKTIRS